MRRSARACRIIRPTGLLDPEITLRPLKDQIDETIEYCRQRVEKRERVLITTLTKRTAEDLTDYLRNVDLKVRYLHSDIDAIQRVEILRALRLGEFDILVGINLLREGLDLPCSMGHGGQLIDLPGRARFQEDTIAKSGVGMKIK